MIYKQITFKVEVPVKVDWGDGNIIAYSAGVVSGVPTGEVEITSDYQVEAIKFLTDTVAQANFESATDLKYADELFKNKDNIQVVYFDSSSPLQTTRQAFANSGIIYHADLTNHTPKQLQYMHLNARRLQCVEGLNTTNAFNAYGLFQNTPNLQHPRKNEIEALEDTDYYGSKYINTFQCTYPIFNTTLSATDTNMGNIFIPIYQVPEDYEFHYPLKQDFTSTNNKCLAHPEGNTYIHQDGYMVLDGDGDYLQVDMVRDGGKGTGSAWIYRRQSGRNYDVVFNDYTSINTNTMWVPTDNNLYFQIGSSSSGRVVSSTPIVADEWTHVAVSYNMTEVKLFINGALVGTNSNGIGDNYYPPVNSWCMIGGGPYAVDAYMFIRDARWYNRKLEDEEIMAIYQEELI